MSLFRKGCNNSNINSPLVLCSSIGSSLHLMDTNTLQVAEVATPVYWRTPFSTLADVTALTEFIVLDIEPLGQVRGRNVLADCQVAKMSDMGVNDKSYNIRTHLGGVLHPGDTVLGYHLVGTNFNNPQFEELESKYGDQIQEVILVKKSYPRKKKNKNRNWRLKRMTRDEGDLLPKKADQERMERDFEMFLRDVEEDTELRASLALYKNTKKTMRMQGVESTNDALPEEMETDGDDDDEDDGLPQISMDELLDEFEDLAVTEG